MIERLLVSLLLVSPVVTGQALDGEVLKWKDATGRVHYGDAPAMRGREDIETLDISSYDRVTIIDSAPRMAEARETAGNERVVMYATDWCGYCEQARSYFERSGIDYVEYNIDKDARARRQYRALGARGVPVILVGDQRMNGFSIAGFNRLYRRMN